MITTIRNTVLELINQHKTREVWHNTNYRSAGIYMIYIDTFQDDKIVPFYIGQTSDFQDRHKQHMTELMSLNRLNRECYEYALLKDLYNGKARTCKIFTYMVNHHCSLRDWHMIILEEIPDRLQRLQKERAYIDQLYAPFFGFNQLNSVLDAIEAHYGTIPKDQLLQTNLNDLKQLLCFSSFGFSQYNWYRVCSTLSPLIEPDSIIDDQLLQITSAKSELDNLTLDLLRMRSFYNFHAHDSARKICEKTIREYFSQHKLTSKDKQKLIITALLFQRERDRATLDKYFARTKSASSNEIFDILRQKHGDEIKSIQDQLEAISENYPNLENRKTELSSFIMQQLIPRDYVSHPLGSLGFTSPIESSAIGENECHIHIEHTCLRVNYDHDFYPEICRIDYRLQLNGVTHGRSAWITNSLSNFFEEKEIYYYEQGFSAGPYHPILVGQSDTHIPVSMEYRNGINESSFRDVPSENAERFLLELNELIDNTTKIIYTTSGYKATILRTIDKPKLKDKLLSKKLRKACKG